MRCTPPVLIVGFVRPVRCVVWSSALSTLKPLYIVHAVWRSGPAPLSIGLDGPHGTGTEDCSGSVWDYMQRHLIVAHFAALHCAVAAQSGPRRWLLRTATPY